MSASPDLGVDCGKLLRLRRRTRRLPYGLGERDKIINAVGGWVELTIVAYEIPAPRCGQAPGVLLTQVVRVRLGERCERPNDGGGLGVDVRKCRNCQSRAAVTRATPWGSHRRTLSPREIKR